MSLEILQIPDNDDVKIKLNACQRKDKKTKRKRYRRFIGMRKFYC